MAKGLRFALEDHRHDDVDGAIRELAQQVQDLQMEVRFLKEPQRNNNSGFNSPMEQMLYLKGLMSFGR